MFTSSGILRYSPKRKASDQHWWLVLDCAPEIGQYYRKLYQQTHNQCRKLAKPFWGSHITVLRNEEPDDAFKHLWGLHEGETIEFQYRGGVEDNHGPDRYRSFYWVNVVCPRFAEIRQELGLPDLSERWKGSYHLTIGSWENPDRKDWYLANFKKGPKPEVTPEMMKVESTGKNRVKVTGSMHDTEITIFAHARKPRAKSDAEITISPNLYTGQINTMARASILDFLND